MGKIEHLTVEADGMGDIVSPLEQKSRRGNARLSWFLGVVR